MRNFCQQTTLLGKVVEIDDTTCSFGLRCRSGDLFYCYFDSPETRYVSVKNLEEPNDNRYTSNCVGETKEERCKRFRTYVNIDCLVCVEGTLYLNMGTRRVDCRTIHLLYVRNEPNGKYPMVFETNNWWVNQIRSLSDRWLFSQFGATDEFDFNKYRTYLDMYFNPKNSLQETATLSRLIYGLATSYMLTGADKYLKAAECGIKYQREHFRYYKDEYCFWCHGKYADKYSRLFESINGDDSGTIPLYEQIYAIAGLTQYYRITQDEDVFCDIKRTVLAFFKYFKDESTHGGYYSHISPIDFSYDNPLLGINCAKKNWNSVGDHIPAYLINLLIVLEPLVCVRKDDKQFIEFVDKCKQLLDETSKLIVEKFPDQNKNIKFVNERFSADWTPDHKYSWQQNRGIVGHNLKIAWNLSRVANYYENKGCDTTKMMKLARDLGNDMVSTNALDLFRGGCYDALEREPKNDMGVEFTWATTKDFWQQEQAILAYLILYGKSKNLDEGKKYLELAQEMSTFWNIKFLDRQNGGVFFRTDCNGTPVIDGDYGDKGGHAISGYHAYELCYLAHVYNCAYVTGEYLTLHLKPKITTKTKQVISVLPDFLPKDLVELKCVYINGVERTLTNDEKCGFYVTLLPEYGECKVECKLGFKTTTYLKEEPKKTVPIKGKVGIIVEKHFDEKEVIEFRKTFPLNGYQIEFITNLWGQKYAEYTGNDYNDPLRVYVDFKDVNKSDYAGFILIGGYAMDRLRYEVTPKEGCKNQSPSVEFIRDILKNTNKKVGVICHSAWLLTVDKELLKGRKLTCSHNVIYDVLNADGQVVYEPNGGTVLTHVDGNLVSGKHPDCVEVFTKRFIDELNKPATISLGY